MCVSSLEAFMSQFSLRKTASFVPEGWIFHPSIALFFSLSEQLPPMIRHQEFRADLRALVHRRDQRSAVRIPRNRIEFAGEVIPIKLLRNFRPHIPRPSAQNGAEEQLEPFFRMMSPLVHVRTYLRAC